MTLATAPDIRDHVVELDDMTAKLVDEAAERLARSGTRLVDDDDWVDRAREAWHQLPAALREPLGRFRRDSGPFGAALLGGLPLGPVPATPTVSGSVQSQTSVAAAVLVMVACGLGDPAAFRAEKGGALVQDVVPVPGQEDVQGNTGSVLLSFHTENAFHEHRPDFVMLLCLRADREGTAGLRTACIRQALPLLSSVDRDALFSEEFVTTPPPSFGAFDPDSVSAHAVLTGDWADPDVCLDFHATTPQTARARLAMAELQQAFGAVAQTIRLRPGELAIVDNRVTVHGRTAFTPGYDGQDRWLQRTFVLADLRRSRRYRPADGNVLVR
ncbi:TauD/TfdA family dioxygenase [Actinokineospora enzanensis]|uniref:TauD/TfdA family dioxygenase n=1 Tax=Actinokineospora enzanensis TaxID=155975 RepID=UPI00037CBD8F|nr:TauD/TfdA family dioxygenase [Actinokineospora enzanensis]